MFERFVNSKDAVVKCFLKIESSDRCGDPRNISPRTDEFLAILGPYVSAIEHAAIDHPYLIKGLNLTERCDKMQALLDYDCFIEVDYKRFDMSISQPILNNFEYYFLSHRFNSPEHGLYLAALVYCMYTRGVNELGVRYDISGTRCSGDAHTSIANGELNCFLTHCCFARLPYDAWISYHEGDDGVIGVKREFISQAMDLMKMTNLYGFLATVKRCDSLNEVNFCGMYLCVSNCRVTQYSDFYRCFSKIWVVNASLSPRIMAVAKCFSYLLLNPGTPILSWFCYYVLNVICITDSQFARALKRLSVDKSTPYMVRAERLTNRQAMRMFRNLREPRITSDVRAGFAMTTGLSPRVQVAYENYYRMLCSMKIIPHKFTQIPYLVETDGPNSQLYCPRGWGTI